jgi:hypothetical protein
MPLRRDSSVSMATCYKLDVPVIESRWGPDSPHPSRTTLGSIHRPAHWAPCLFLRVKRPGWGVNKLRRHSASHYFCGPSSSVLGWNLPLPLLYLHLYQSSVYQRKGALEIQQIVHSCIFNSSDVVLIPFVPWASCHTLHLQPQISYASNIQSLVASSFGGIIPHHPASSRNIPHHPRCVIQYW